MKRRFDVPGDAIPYEATVLILSEVDSCFGRPYGDLFAEVRAALGCERQLVEEHRRTLEDLPDFETLVQYDVWVVHHSCLLLEDTADTLPQLTASSLPEETQVVVTIDTDDDEMADYLGQKVEATYGEVVTAVSSRPGLVYFLVGHLKTASPCSTAGLEYIVSRNNTIADRIGQHQEDD